MSRETNGGSGHYQPLDARALTRVLAGLPAVAARLGGHPARWVVTPLSGGNVNQIFSVRGPKGSVCTKQSLPYLRLLGESAPMPVSRIAFEHRTLVEHARHAPERFARIYHFDDALCLLVMEYLSEHRELRQALIDAQCFPHTARDLGDYLARVLFHTSDLALPSAERRRRAAAMAGNAGMYRFIEDLSFTEPYMLHPRNAWNAPHLDAIAAQFRRDAALKIAVSRLKRRYMTAAEALVHGDLHTGSVLITEDDTRVVDLELSSYGPMGWDLGSFFAHVLLNYFAQPGHPDPHGRRPACQQWALQLVEQVWEHFCLGFAHLWDTARTGDAYPAEWFGPDNGGARAERAALDALLADILNDSLGFAGAEMTRRILNLGQVPDLELIEPPEHRAMFETRALLFARHLTVNAASIGHLSEITQGARNALLVSPAQS